MSWIARLLRRWGFVRLSDYGLAVAPDGTLVPLANATPEMSARVAPELDLHASQLPANTFDVSHLIAEPAKLLEEGNEARRPRRKSMLMWAETDESETVADHSEAEESTAAAPRVESAPRARRPLPLRAAEATGMTRAAPEAQVERGEPDTDEEAKWEAMLAEARARAANADGEMARQASEEPQTEADWEAVIAAAKSQPELKTDDDDLEYMSDDDVTLAEGDGDEVVDESGESPGADEEPQTEADWERMLARAKLRSPSVQTPAASVRALSATDAGWNAPAEASDSAMATAIDNLAVGDTTQVSPARERDEWESKMAEIQSRSELEEERRRRAAREAQRLSRRATPGHTTRTLQAMVSRSSGPRRSRLAAGTEPPPRMTTAPGLGAGDATRVMRKRAPSMPAAARPALKPTASASPLPRLTTRLGGNK